MPCMHLMKQKDSVSGGMGVLGTTFNNLCTFMWECVGESVDNKPCSIEIDQV